MLSLALTLSMQTGKLDLVKLEALIRTDPAAAAKWIRASIKPEDLKNGANPIDQGTLALFAIDPGTESSAKLQIHGKSERTEKLTRLDKTLWIALTKFEDGEGFPFDYVVGETVTRAKVQFEVYNPNPLTMTPPGGFKGELREMGEWKSRIFPETTRKWYIYLPPNFSATKEYPLLVAQDAQWDRQWIANGLENCAREKLIPDTVGVFIEPGQRVAGTYSNRAFEYDSLNPTYSKFIHEEILPEVEKIVKLSKDPAKRAITGMSSGGICSFTMCWERPDSFGTALTFIGSYTNIASGPTKREGGHNYPFMVRKMDKRPFKIFMQDGENDLNNEHGVWWLSNLQLMEALKWKGYEVSWNPGKGFHSTKQARRIFDQALVFWNGVK